MYRLVLTSNFKMSSYDIVVPDDYVPRRLPDYCMLDVRCSLCRFRYDEDDIITACKCIMPFQGQMILLFS